MTAKAFAPSGVVALVTDFGVGDDFVGMVHGSILSVDSSIRIVDLSHDIVPGDEETAAFLLLHDHSYFPAGTVFVAVIDPGVGTERAILAAHIGDHVYIAPDNGLLDPLLKAGTVHELRSVENTALFREQISKTFHGRDIFAPVAGFLASGGKLADVGPKVDTWKSGPNLRPEAIGRELHGHVMLVDRFGNLITNLVAKDVEGKVIVVSRRTLRQVSTFFEGQESEPVWTIGSKNTVEIVVNGGNASKMLGIGRGHRVVARVPG